MRKINLLILPTTFLPYIFSLILLLVPSPSPAQQSHDVYVDTAGIMRWPESGTEVQGFGINYTLPFAHAYRMAQASGTNHISAIDQDLAHFSRLGFDLFRVHVWDCEISDSLGNLIPNHHLELFDYQLHKMKEQGMKIVLTPIAFWGNGWPQPDEQTPGFSAKYGKDSCLTIEEAILAQENYLFQFLNHINPHTGVAYKNDPDIIAFEVSNEPHHRGTPEQVRSYIERMVKSMRKTGCQKPIFYNVSHSIHLADTYFSSGIQGGTFQWYPTGLGAQRPLRGNLLPNVDDYRIPFNDVIEKHGAAKLVYEFDAADVDRSFLYPAMARSFREAGIQIATHFSWDPTFMAHYNTEYNTHTMNLLYTPQKALALMICGEIFHEIPMNKDWGSYPENTAFGPFTISAEKDLAVMNTAQKYLYTNSTETGPVNPDSLEFVAGYGNSPIVRYTGSGAYFLEKLEHAVWRLQVYPDAIPVANPFGRNSPNRTLFVLNDRERNMQILLPGLEKSFVLTSAADLQSSIHADARGNFTVRPGTYIVTPRGLEPSTADIGIPDSLRFRGNYIDKVYFSHSPPAEANALEELMLNAFLATKDAPEKVELIHLGKDWKTTTLEMTEVTPYIYQVKLPAGLIEPGYNEYYITAKTQDGTMTWPGEVKAHPWDWDFGNTRPYRYLAVDKDHPLALFEASKDWREIVGNWVSTAGLIPGGAYRLPAYSISLDHLSEVDPENPNAKPVEDYSFRYDFSEKVSGRRSSLASMNKLKIKAKSLGEAPTPLQMALVLKDGSAWGATVQLNPSWKQIELSLSELRQIKLVTLPRPYPTFLPYYFISDSQTAFDLSRANALQFSLGPELNTDNIQWPIGIAIESVYLE